jgi:5-methyltetrahydropteroyltriglutamate--homocysteine methyltransferase
MLSTRRPSRSRRPEIRKARADHKAGRISGDAYEDLMRGETDRVIALQEDIGLDVLVRGRRSATTWCSTSPRNSTGSRSQSRAGSSRMEAGMSGRQSCMGRASARADDVDCVRYAQSRTDKQMKGMLTGPVTMLAWSFVRDGLAAG